MRKLILLLLVAGALIGLPPAAAATKPTTITVAVGKKGVAGGPKKVRLKKGARVVLVVRSVYAGNVHVHGYDLERPVKAGGTVRISFTARIAGRFVVELHARVSLPIAELEVRL